MRAPVSLSPEELLAVLARARARSLRDWVILVTLYWHGFRVSEVVPSSTRQLGLFFTRDRAEARAAENHGSVISEVQRRVQGKMRSCFLVTSVTPRRRPGLTPEAIEGEEITQQRLKHSLETTQQIFEHENPLLNERVAWEEWAAARGRLGKKGAAAHSRPGMQQKHILSHSSPQSPLFNISRGQVWRLFRRYATEAGLPRRKRHPHVLKHTIGTELAAVLPLPEVQVHLGHRSLASTGKYTLPPEDAVTRKVGDAIRAKHELRPQPKPLPPSPLA
jgi:hypothetical protein